MFYSFATAERSYGNGVKMMKKAVNSRKFDVSCSAVNKLEPEPERIDVSEFLTTEVLSMQHITMLLVLLRSK